MAALADPDCYLKTAQPQRSFLELTEVEALFQAAAQLEQERRGLGWTEVRAIRASTEPAIRLAHRYGVSDTLVRKIRTGELWTDRPERRRNDVPRLAIVATLVLAGPRISELCLLEGRHIDLARRRIRMPRVKADASERIVPMVPALHEILLADRAEHGRGGAEPGLATRNGTRNTPDNLRRRVIAGVHERANELLRGDGGAEIAQLTAAHAAQDVRVAARRGRREPTARDVPARTHRSQAHHEGLPAGPGHGRRGRSAPRKRARTRPLRRSPDG